MNKKLNDSIPALCKDFPDFKSFNDDFKGEYEIISLSTVSWRDDGPFAINLEVEFTNGAMKGQRKGFTAIKSKK